ncbi:MAG TPA: hypothetical protein DCY20_08665, partial [Firmicutes bacterium]|nr:hypothetical protein [Bacillota bacterium]
MKKLFFTLILMSFLTGCLNTATIKERALVQMMGIDYDPTYSTFKVTLQIFSPEGGGGKTAIDSSKQNVRYIQNEGTNLYEAVKNITLKQGKIPFYGDNRVIIIGESAAKQSLTQIMGYLNNDHEARSNMKILVAKGDAAEIIKTPLGQGIIPAQGVSEMIQHGFINGKVFSTTLLDLGQAYTSSTISPVIPIIT